MFGKYRCRFCNNKEFKNKSIWLEHEKVCRETYIDKLKKEHNYVDRKIQKCCFLCEHCFAYRNLDEDITSLECTKYNQKGTNYVMFSTEPTNVCDDFEMSLSWKGDRW